MWHQIMAKITKFLSLGKQKLQSLFSGEKSENLQGSEKPLSEAEIFDRAYQKATKEFAPQTLEEFVSLIQRTPAKVLSQTDRRRIAAVMSFDERQVSDLMAKEKDMVFVNEKDFLGPLMLDRLYKSGFTNFPVVDNQNHVQGIIHTEELNALTIKKTDRAGKYMTKEIFALHASDSLEFAISEIARTNSYYFLVLDKNEKLAGFFTVQMLLDYLLGI